MEIFFYQSPLEVPFATPYSREFFTDKQVLLISNKSEILDKFETHRAVIMEDGITKIIGTKVFVPVVVKTVFLTWLKAEYSNIDWQAKTEFADFRPEVTDELQAFFQQLRIVEKCEGGTMQPDPTKKVELGENKFAEATADASKYISMGFAVAVLLSLAVILLFFLKPVEEIKQAQKQPTEITSVGSNNKIRTELIREIERQIGETVAAERDDWYVTRQDKKSHVLTEDGTFFGVSKKIWALQSISSEERALIEKTSIDLLKKILDAYREKPKVKDDRNKCPNLQKIYNFCCSNTGLDKVKNQIDEQFPDCKSTCPSPSTTGK